RPLPARTDIGPHEIDRDVAAAIGGGGDAPEDQDAQQHAAEVVAVRDLQAEAAQRDGDEDVGCDQPHEQGGDRLDRVDDAVHHTALHADPPTRPPGRQSPAPYFLMLSSNSFQIWSGLPPALATASAHCFCSGAAAVFQAFSWSAVSG